MNYIINPLWIYLLDVLKDVGAMLVIVLLFAFCVTIVSAIFYICYKAYGYDNTDAEYKISKRVTKISTIVTIVVAIIVGLIPSQKTMYTMLVASYVTEENIDAANETVTDMIDYIFEKVDELQDNEISESENR